MGGGEGERVGVCWSEECRGKDGGRGEGERGEGGREGVREGGKE